ncbi:3' terminal RNA ribose 2'-O-methyltransferase Hen1 [Bacillus sp. FJAT-27445]|uniref:3' terminal RNA ribose 2'-O-methyltransferase Hen1 n=1 Tax=Bacillus sp. FJAT-27445 TaxID=1679166 RepID=UPI0007437E54|nr:3' terminal RNA ribose 2'-O-methyltransferase Hen1 [Bacillus sp. FJAT-27445]
MQLTIRAFGEGAGMVSHLLAKNPSNLYERGHKGHLVRLFYSKFTDNEVDVTIFVTPDPIELIKNSGSVYDITHYINDREFAVSSIFLSLIRTALGTALNGQPKEDYLEWVDHSFDLEFEFSPIASSLSDDHIRTLFEPLGFNVEISRAETDYNFDFKTKSSIRSILLKGKTTLKMGLRQLFVLIPVLDNYKHYFIDEREIEKLERYGEGWLDHHPEREFILRQALRFREVYRMAGIQEETKANALKDLVVDSEIANVTDSQTALQEENTAASEIEEDEIQAPKARLNDLRYEKIIELINRLPKRDRIADFGSGEGKLSFRLGFVPGMKEIFAIEPSESATLKARERFKKGEHIDGFVSPTQLWGSLFYYDDRLKGMDVMILCEVIEHIDQERLPKVMETILHQYRPNTLFVTTPNKEYNAVYDLNEMRHTDHRFEWTRDEFQNWCKALIEDKSYETHFEGIGDSHPEYGHPTQMCIFKRKDGAR